MTLYEETKKMKVFYEKLDMSLQILIDRYKNYFDEHKKDRIFILNQFSRDLERISNLLDNYGYTYTPTDAVDVSEEVFEIMVGRYLEGFQKFIDDGDGNLETLNVDIKNLQTIIDKHKNVSEHFI